MFREGGAGVGDLGQAPHISVKGVHTSLVLRVDRAAEKLGQPGEHIGRR